MDAASFVRELNNTTIQLYEVKESMINTVDEGIPTLKTIPRTMKLHQIFTLSRLELKYRDISYLDIDCKEHACDNFVFPIEGKKKVSTNEEKNADHCDTDFPEILTQENFDSDQHDTKRSDQDDQMHQLRNCATFEDVQLLFPRSTTETLVIDNHDLSNDNIYLVGLSSNSKKYKDDENDAERIEVVKDDDDLTMKQVKNDHDTAAQMRQLRNCNTFAEVQTLCSELSTASSLDGKDRYVLDDKLLVDESSIDLYPDDVPNDTNYFPFSVRANGDCLPACGSVFLYGTDVNPEEVRLKIIQELVLHKDSYLNATYLSRGLENPCRNILKSYAMYSHEYEHGIVHSQSYRRHI